MKIQFLGAAGNVTGSRHLLEAGRSRILVDCGLYQEREFLDRNWDDFPVPPSGVQNVLLTHAHLDHCGYLPRLVKQGFRGGIFCTPPTRDIAQVVLLDAARIQEEDAATKSKRHQREGRRGAHPEVPLYTVDDAKRVFPLFRTVPYGEPVRVSPDLKATFRNAGHILGAASIEVEATDPAGTKTIVFSGDVGRWDRPIVDDPTVPEKADCLLIESTYGDRVHEDPEAGVRNLQDTIVQAQGRGGNIVIPIFATERAQDILYYLRLLLKTGRIAPVPVFVDSPMAIEVTRIFQRSLAYLDAETRGLIEKGESPFSFPQLEFAATVEQSKAINSRGGTSIILSGSGMCNGGRVKHHLTQNISRPESAIIFVGYQAEGTLGREISEGAGSVRIFGQSYPVRARVTSVGGFSGHADRRELARWTSGLKEAPAKIFVIHGEKEASETLAGDLRGRFGGSEVTVQQYRQEVAL